MSQGKGAKRLPCGFLLQLQNGHVSLLDKSPSVVLSIWAPVAAGSEQTYAVAASVLR